MKHLDGESIDIADSREVDFGLLQSQIDSRQWGRDEDISTILEKLNTNTSLCRMIFVIIFFLILIYAFLAPLYFLPLHYK